MTPAQLGVIMSMVVPIATFVLVILVLYIEHATRRKRDSLHTQIYLKALEMGQPLPEGLFKTNPKKKASPLKTAIIILSVTVGCIAYAFVDGDRNKAAWCLIPLFLGVGFLIIHFILRKRGGDENK